MESSFKEKQSRKRYAKSFVRVPTMFILVTGLILGVDLCAGLGRSFLPTVDHRRVFYNIAHMVNSIKEVDEFLGRQANAIETDVSFTSDGFPSMTQHGFPCDCLRACGDSANFTEFVNYVRQKVDSNANIALLLLDLKVTKLKNEAKLAAGRHVVSILSKHLWEPAIQRLNVVLSIPRTQDHQVIEGVLDGLAAPYMQQYVRHIGYDLSTGKDLEKTAEVYNSYHLYDRIWQGDGITNCVSTLRSNKELKRALNLRDIGGHPHKVYEWTVDLSSFQAAALDLGVDGIITNVPERLDTLIRENFADKYRLATIRDDPWERHASFEAPETTRKPITNIVKNFREAGEQKLKFAADTVKGIFGRSNL